jgi:sec-independent protein translocase protein TatB
MLDIGWPEMLVVAIVLIVVVGPKDLPGMLRTFGRTTAKLRAMAGDFRKQFDEALKEAELDDVKGAFDDVRKLNPAADLRKAFSPMEQAAKDVRSGLDSAMKPTAKPQAEEDAAKGSVSTGTEAKPAAPIKNGHDAAVADGAGKAAASTAKQAGKPATKSKAASPASARPAAAKAGSAKTSSAKSGATASGATKSGAAKTGGAKSAVKPASKPAAKKTAKAGAAAKKGGQAS